MKTARIITAIALAAATLALTPSAYAEPPEYFAGEHVDNGLAVTLPGHGTVGTYTYAVNTPLGPSATAYCIDLATDYRKGAALRESHWSDAPAIAPYAAAVNWLLHNSYPYLPLNQVVGAEPFRNGLSTSEAVAATQAAIWHYSNGIALTVDRISGTDDEKRDVFALYSYLVGPANVGLSEVPDASVSLSANGEPGIAGSRIGPIALATTTTAELTLTSAPEGARIVDASGNPVTGPTTSGEIFLDVPSDADPGEATITASAAAQIPTGRIFTPTRSDAESATQSLVLATVQRDTAKATITVPWDAAPVTTSPPTTTVVPPVTETPSTETPPAEPTSEAPTPPVTPPAPQPTVVPAAIPQATNQPVLADTGADPARWSLIAGALLLTGFGALLLGRRTAKA